MILWIQAYETAPKNTCPTFFIFTFGRLLSRPDDLMSSYVAWRHHLTLMINSAKFQGNSTYFCWDLTRGFYHLQERIFAFRVETLSLSGFSWSSFYTHCTNCIKHKLVFGFCNRFLLQDGAIFRYTARRKEKSNCVACPYAPKSFSCHVLEMIFLSCSLLLFMI